MTNSRVTRTNTKVTGAFRSRTAFAPPRIRMTGGELIIAGWSKQAITGGVGLLNSHRSSIGPLIEPNGGHVILDPDVWLLD